MRPEKPRNPWSEVFKGVNDFVRWYSDLDRRIPRWFDERRSGIQRFVESVSKFADEVPVGLAIASVMFHRGGWSEVPLDEMDLSEFSVLIVTLIEGQATSEEEVREELDAALGDYYRRDDHAALSASNLTMSRHAKAADLRRRDSNSPLDGG